MFFSSTADFSAFWERMLYGISNRTTTTEATHDIYFFIVQLL
jgi:hypothetical protein